MAFNPPVGVANGATYGYGNMLWEYAASSGVWNIVGGSIIGAVGPEGPAGPAGSDNIPLATTSLTGVASFRPSDFVVSVTGNVGIQPIYARLAGDNQMVGQNTFFAEQGTVFSYGITATQINTQNIFPLNSIGGESGYIQISSGSIQLINTNIGIGGEGGDPAVISVNNNVPSPSIQMYTINAAGYENLIDLQSTGLIFGGAAYDSPLMITGGVFRNPSELAPHFTTTSNDLIVNGISGSIQRFTITPTGPVTIKAGTGWHSLTAATETISLIIQNKSTHTGAFDSSILTDGSGSPILFGPDTVSNFSVVGGVTVLTLMRVNKGGGVGLTMGFVISTGMTAANITIN